MAHSVQCNCILALYFSVASLECDGFFFFVCLKEKKLFFSIFFHFSFAFLVGCSITALDPDDWGRIKAVVRDTSREFCALIDCSNKEEEETKKLKKDDNNTSLLL